MAFLLVNLLYYTTSTNQRLTKTIKYMKRYFVILLAIIACQVAVMAQPVATFKESTYDFGTIKESKGPVKHTFEVVNTGDKPLIIIDAVASCGCTRPSYTAKPIKPGKKGKVEVTFSPVGRAGTFRKTVKVRTNCVEKVSSLIITGSIIPKSKE